MRVKRASPFLLLAASSLTHALELSQGAGGSTIRTRKRELVEGKAKEFVPQDPVASSRPSVKPLRGTEEAPVDGQDGKPKVGPFVDYDSKKEVADGDAPTSTKPRAEDLKKWTDAGSEEWRLEDIPEKNDGVMNDDTRVGPKKGTDGTSGGISEKERERQKKGYEGNRPQEPKQAPELPHSEQEMIQRDGQQEKTTTYPKEGEKKDTEYTDGGYGIAKPADLPKKPYATEPSNVEDGPPVESTSTHSSWLTDTMPYTEGQTNPAPPTKKLTDHLLPSMSIPDSETWHEWFHSFVLSFTMIIFSEIGDKTFLVAALMSMRHPRILVFSAALGALIVMTVLSAVLGHAFPTLLPKRLTTFAAAMLFLVFGAKGLREGLAMPPGAGGVGEEMKEVEAELEEKEHELNIQHRRSSTLSPYALESGRGRRSARDQILPLKPAEPSPPSSRSTSPSPNNPKRKGKSKSTLAGLQNLLSLVLSPAWVQTFIMTFLGEWGDRSQIATIAMAAGQDYWWVTLGAISGHAICTGLAVLGGRALAGRVSMRVVTIGGAGAFLVFGVIYLWECLLEGS